MKLAIYFVLVASLNFVGPVSKCVLTYMPNNDELGDRLAILYIGNFKLVTGVEYLAFNNNVSPEGGRMVKLMSCNISLDISQPYKDVLEAVR